ARTRSFRMPAKVGGWIAYQVGRAPEEAQDSTSADSAAAAPGAVEPQRTEPGRMPEPPAGAAPADSVKPVDHKREEGYPLVLRNLATAEERRIEDAVTYMFSEDGARLVYSRADKAGSVDGVYVMETGTGAVTTLLAGKARYEQ